MFAQILIRAITSVSIVVGLLSNVDAQKHRTNSKKTHRKSVSTSRKPISLGVLNGRAVTLVRPTYPAAAAVHNVQGSVEILVLIDETGNVISAVARPGANPFLVNAAETAARASTFQPIILGNEPHKVYGSILYIFRRDTMNWLELGFSTNSFKTLCTYLPSGFDEERQFLCEREQAEFGDRKEARQTAVALITGKLTNDSKELWLFMVGVELNELVYHHWENERRESAERALTVLLTNQPAGITPALGTSIKALTDSGNHKEFDVNLKYLVSRLYAFGQ